MKKKILICFLVFISSNDLFSQQDKLITNFMYDKISINPGKTGIDMNNSICATSIYRNQWDKVDGAPNSAMFNIEGNMERFFSGGLGLSFFHDAIGFNRQNNLMLNYSYPIKINAKNEIRFGLGLGMLNFGMKPNWITTNPGTFDKTLPTAFSSTALDLNFGIFYKYIWFSNL